MGAKRKNKPGAGRPALKKGIEKKSSYTVSITLTEKTKIVKRHGSLTRAILTTI